MALVDIVAGSSWPHLYTQVFLFSSCFCQQLIALDTVDVIVPNQTYTFIGYKGSGEFSKADTIRRKGLHDELHDVLHMYMHVY